MEEAETFCKAKLAEMGVNTDSETEPEATEAPTEVPTEAPTKTEAPTETPTEASTDASTDAPTDAPKPEKGCGSAVGTVFAGVAVLLLSCGTVLRKRED